MTTKCPTKAPVTIISYDLLSKLSGQFKEIGPGFVIAVSLIVFIDSLCEHVRSMCFMWHLLIGRVTFSKELQNRSIKGSASINKGIQSLFCFFLLGF